MAIAGFEEVGKLVCFLFNDSGLIHSRNRNGIPALSRENFEAEDRLRFVFGDNFDIFGSGGESIVYGKLAEYILTRSPADRRQIEVNIGHLIHAYMDVVGESPFEKYNESITENIFALGDVDNDGMLNVDELIGILRTTGIVITDAKIRYHYTLFRVINRENFALLIQMFTAQTGIPIIERFTTYYDQLLLSHQEGPEARDHARPYARDRARPYAEEDLDEYGFQRYNSADFEDGHAGIPDAERQPARLRLPLAQPPAAREPERIHSADARYRGPAAREPERPAAGVVLPSIEDLIPGTRYKWRHLQMAFAPRDLARGMAGEINIHELVPRLRHVDLGFDILEDLMRANGRVFPRRDERVTTEHLVPFIQHLGRMLIRQNEGASDAILREKGFVNRDTYNRLSNQLAERGEGTFNDLQVEFNAASRQGRNYTGAYIMHMFISLFDVFPQYSEIWSRSILLVLQSACGVDRLTQQSVVMSCGDGVFGRIPMFVSAGFNDFRQVPLVRDDIYNSIVERDVNSDRIDARDARCRELLIQFSGTTHERITLANISAYIINETRRDPDPAVRWGDHIASWWRRTGESDSTYLAGGKKRNTRRKIKKYKKSIKNKKI